MLHNLKHISIYAFLIITNCFSMNEKQNILDQLISENRSFHKEDVYPQIELITDDHILFNINTLTCHCNCYMIDLKQNAIIKQIEIKKPNHIRTHLSMHLDRKLFSLCQPEGIAIYDTKNGDMQKSHPLNRNQIFCKSVFSPSDTSIFYWDTAHSDIIQWNYESNTIKNVSLTDDIHNLADTNKWLDCHPTKPYLASIQYYGAVIIYNYHNASIVKKINPNYESYEKYDYIKYSPDGSLIANYSEDQLVNIMDTDSYNNIAQYTCNPTQLIQHITFLNNSILAILLYPKRNIEYFDIKNKKIVAITQTMAKNFASPFDNFSFTLNKKQSILTCRNNYSLTDVPFKAHYQPEAKKRLPYILFFLKNYQINEYDLLPQDIINILRSKVLEAFKRT